MHVRTTVNQVLELSGHSWSPSLDTYPLGSEFSELYADLLGTTTHTTRTTPSQCADKLRADVTRS